MTSPGVTQSSAKSSKIRSQSVERFTIPVKDVVATVLGERTPEGAPCTIRIEGIYLVIDIEIPPAHLDRHKQVTSVPAQKGGDLSRRAAMLCGEKGFQTFMDAANADRAAERLRDTCKIGSRAELDQNEAAAILFRDISARYKLWCDGYDD